MDRAQTRLCNWNKWFCGITYIFLSRPKYKLSISNVEIPERVERANVQKIAPLDATHVTHVSRALACFTRFIPEDHGQARENGRNGGFGTHLSNGR